MPATQSLTIPPEWLHVMDSILGTSQPIQPDSEEASTSIASPLSVLICGAKNVGKSTFAKFTINSLLHRSVFPCLPKTKLIHSFIFFPTIYIDMMQLHILRRMWDSASSHPRV